MSDSKTVLICPKCNIRPRYRAGAPCVPCRTDAQRARREAKRDGTYFKITVEKPEIPPEAHPTAPVPLEPLESAYKVREEQFARRSLQKEHSALLEENTHLKALLHAASEVKRPFQTIVYDKSKDERSDAIACALASDWHVEEVVDKAAVHGLNEYSPDIARQRGRAFFLNLLKLTDIVARDSKVTTIWMGWLGDFFSGHIHEELMASCAMAPGDAAQLAKEILCSGIEFLLRESSYILEIDALPGNHGRMTKQVWFSDPTGTSLETFMYRAIADRYYANPRVRLHVADHAMVYRKFFENFTMRLIHGYEMKFGGGVGGITIPVRKALAQWNIAMPAKLTCFGHFHQRIDGGDFLGNGSMIGYNTYAEQIKAAFEEPVQSFFTIHARHGGQKSIVAPVWLDD